MRTTDRGMFESEAHYTDRIAHLRGVISPPQPDPIIPEPPPIEPITPPPDPGPLGPLNGMVADLADAIKGGDIPRATNLATDVVSSLSALSPPQPEPPPIPPDLAPPPPDPGPAAAPSTGDQPVQPPIP